MCRTKTSKVITRVLLILFLVDFVFEGNCLALHVLSIAYHVDLSGNFVEKSSMYTLI